MWLFSSRFESSKRMTVAHVSISDPQGCSPAKEKGHQCTKDIPNPAKSPQGKPPAPAKEDLVMPESSTPGALRQAQNTHHAIHTPAPNPHANLAQAQAPPTKTPRPQQYSRLDHYCIVCFCHSWCMNSIDHEDSYKGIQNLQYLS